MASDIAVHIRGLKGCLLRPDENIPKLEALFQTADRVRHHTFNLLAMYANIVAAEPEGAPGRLEGDLVFSQTVIQQALSLGRPARKRYANAGISPQMREAERRYYSDELEHIRERTPDGVARVEAPLYGRTFAAEMSVQIVTAFKNCLHIDTHQHQKQYLKAMYGVSGPHATALANRLSTSVAQRNLDAVEAHVKQSQAIVNRQARELDAAILNNLHPVLIQELQVRVDAATREVVRQRNEAAHNPAVALASLNAANPLDEAKHHRHLVNNRDAIVGLFPEMTLGEILDVELLRIPDLQQQADLLRYRYALLQELDVHADPLTQKFFDLVPASNYKRSFHLLDKDLIAHLAPLDDEGHIRASGRGVTLAQLLPHVFIMEKLDELLPKIRADGTRRLNYGNSLMCDGVQLQVRLVTQAHAAKKARKEVRTAQTRAVIQAGGVRPVYAQVPRAEQNEDEAVAAQRRFQVARRLLQANVHIIHENARVVGCDPGRVNILAYCKEQIDPVTLLIGPPGEAKLVTRKSYRKKTGMAARELAAADRVEAYRADTLEFGVAETAVAGARTKTAIQAQLLAALKIRGLHFDTLYAYYTLEENVRVKFANFIGKQSFADKLANEIFDRPLTVLVVGDGKFEGGAKWLIARLKLYGDVRFDDEYCTTLRDSRPGHAKMFSPPKEMVVKELGNDMGQRSYLKRIQGLKQSGSSGSSYLWNRDKNAAINILQNFLADCFYGGRDARFRRGGAQEPKPRCLYYGYKSRVGGGVGFKRFMMRGWVEPL